MRDLSIHWPVTPPNLAAVLGIKPHTLMKDVMKRALFPGPDDIVNDLVAIELAEARGVNLRIIDDHDDGFEHSITS